MNLATARAMHARTGDRAAQDARREAAQLVIQFLGESVLTSLLALVLALALTEMLLPVFAGFLQRPIDHLYLPYWPELLLILRVAILAGLISGSYPALVLASFRPATVLRTNGSGQAGSGRLRTILVVLQFAVSIGLGVAATVVFSQIDFARNIDFGFQRDNILIVGHAGRVFTDGRASFCRHCAPSPGYSTSPCPAWCLSTPARAWIRSRSPAEPDLILLNQMVISPGFPRFYGMRFCSQVARSPQRGRRMKSTPGR